jgi:hypothetical protein
MVSVFMDLSLYNDVKKRGAYVMAHFTAGKDADGHVKFSNRDVKCAVWGQQDTSDLPSCDAKRYILCMRHKSKPHKTYVKEMRYGGTANEQCLAGNAQYDEDGLATAVRCVEMDGSACDTNYKDDTSKCYPMATSYDEAFHTCDKDGRRLPTLDELKDLCVGTGCSYNHFNAWSSEECSDNAIFVANRKRGHFVYAHKSDDGAVTGFHCLEDEATAGLNGVATVSRCCSKSDQSCDSDPNGQCLPTDVTLDAYEDSCERAAMVTCTNWRLSAKCPGTGCDYDVKYARSASVCFF